MKALVLTDVGKFDIKDVESPAIGDKDVLVRVRAASICGSDIHGYDGSSGRRIPPLIIGHEAAGDIAEVGKDVVGYKVGDRVTFDSTEFCGECSYCKQGRINLCENRKVLGVSCGTYQRDGAMAEYISVPSRLLYKISDNTPYSTAAIVEPLTIAMRAIGRVNLQLGDTVMVIGAGTIGLLLVKLLKISSAAKIVVSDLDEKKLEMAKNNGADVCIGKGDNAEEIIKGMTKHGADVVFEAVGITPTVRTAISCVKNGGDIVLVGNVSKSIDFPLQEVVTRELSFHASCASAGEYDRCLELLAADKVDLSDIVSKVVPLEEGQEWFDRLHGAEPGLIKVVLEP